MKIKKSTAILLTIVLSLPLLTAFAGFNHWGDELWPRRRKAPTPEEIRTHANDGGYELKISFTPGKRHNHPLMAFWLEDADGNYIRSLYVAQSIAKGYFRHGDATSGRWEPGPLRRPAALPYWGHKRGIKAEDGFYIPTQDNPMPDAVTGPTPKAGFTLTTQTGSNTPSVFVIAMEINQSWDWNQYWHNNKYPDDPYYKTSSQPAVVYKVTIDTRNPQQEYQLKPVGHSHWSGADGNLYEGLNTLTTALEIANEVKVEIRLP